VELPRFARVVFIFNFMTFRLFLRALLLGLLILSCGWTQQYTISTYAGTGSAGYSGDGAGAAAAQLNLPLGIAFDSSGNMYIADSFNYRVREISGGVISTVAGNGTPGFISEIVSSKALATSAELLGPSGVAVDLAGDIYIADSSNHVVWEVVEGTTATALGITAGDIVQIAGTNTGGYAGDGGLAGLAELDFPTSIAVDSSNNVYIADSANNVIREITATDGIINTIVGGFATVQQLNDPEAVLVDSFGNLYISEQSGLRISKFSNGVLTTIVGNGEIGYAGDGGPGVDAEVDEPTAIALDSHGYLYICDTDNNLIRKLSPEGIITTIAGTTINGLPDAGFYGDGGFANKALLNFPHGVAVDPSGKVYIADTDNNRIRLLSPVAPAVAGGGVLNAASFELPISPGGLATVFGSDFTGAGQTAIAASLPLASSLGGVSVQVNGVSAPVLYESSGQINFQIPWQTKPGTATLTVSNNGVASSQVNITVLANGPGIFVSGSHAIVENSDFSLNSSGNPAKAGSTIMAYLTDAGAVSNQPADGAPAGSSPLSQVTAAFSATIGGQSANVSFAGLAPGFVGLWQFNIVVPSGVTAGNLPLVVTVGGQNSNSADVSVTP
jgi:uncharacterized protein (TIGR03437 family)